MFIEYAILDNAKNLTKELALIALKISRSNITVIYRLQVSSHETDTGSGVEAPRQRRSDRALLAAGSGLARVALQRGRAPPRRLRVRLQRGPGHATTHDQQGSSHFQHCVEQTPTSKHFTVCQTNCLKILSSLIVCQLIVPGSVQKLKWQKYQTRQRKEFHLNM